MAPEKTIALPTFITGSIDLNRLIREVQNIDNVLHQLQLRTPGTQVKLPKTSYLLDQLVVYYKLNLLRQNDRDSLIKYLVRVKSQSPTVHISFSSDPSPQFLEKVVSWLRVNVHPEILLTVGLQPTIGAGCIVRTTNKYFDFSLADNLKKSKSLLLNKIVDESGQPIPAGPIQ